MGLGLVFWMFLLFSPLAWVGQANADDSENYGTVIGIVSCATRCLALATWHLWGANSRRQPLFA